MPDLALRLALILLFATGATTVAMAAAEGVPGTLGLQHHHALLALLGLTLIAAVRWPALRLPAVAAALAAKLSLLALVGIVPASSMAPAQAGTEALQALALLLAGAILLREARREARWEGAALRRQET
jgi:hypothetical protein